MNNMQSGKKCSTEEAKIAKERVKKEKVSDIKELKKNKEVGLDGLIFLIVTAPFGVVTYFRTRDKIVNRLLKNLDMLKPHKSIPDKSLSIKN